MSYLNSLARAARSTARSTVFASAFHTLNHSGPRKRFWCGAAAVATVAVSSVILSPTIRLDNDRVTYSEPTVDPATSIAFPTTILMPSKTPIPPMTLVGLGVRTVSFLGIKVYSVGFYADLNNPHLKIPVDMSTDEKIEHIVRNTSCLVRIVPVRRTSYAHLRDAFMRALQARLALAKKYNLISEEEAQAVGSPMRKLKTLFPNSPLEKHVPLDIYLTAPAPGKPRALAFRDLGAIENDWVATELVLHYFDGPGPSPPLKKSVANRLASFQKEPGL